MNMNEMYTSATFETDLLNAGGKKAIFKILLSNSQILSANYLACQLINYNSDELCSAKLENIIHDSYKEKWLNLKREFFEYSAQKSYGSENLFELISKNTGPVVVYLHLKKLDNPEQCLVLAESIDQKEVSVSVDREGKIISFDEEVAFIFQYSRSELVGLNIHTILPAIHYTENFAIFCCKFSKQYITGRTKNGDSFPVSLSINCTSSDSEIFQIVLWIYLNLNGLLILNEKLFLTNCNYHFVKLFFGHSPDEVIYKPIISLIPTFFNDIRFQSSRKHQCSNEHHGFLNESPRKKRLYKQACNSDSIDESFTSTHCMSELAPNFTTDSLENISKARLFDDSVIDVQSKLKIKTVMSYNIRERNRSEKNLNDECQFHSQVPLIVNCDDKSDKCKNDGNLDIDLFRECFPEAGAKFAGFGNHSDGSCIKIKYQVKNVALSEETCYFVWISLDLSQIIEFSNRLNDLKDTSLYRTSTDRFCAKDKIYCDQLDRQYNISQCQEVLIGGEYSQHYTNLMEIGKGAFQYVKMAVRNSDRLLVVTKFIKKQNVNVSSWVFDPDLNMKIPLEISFLLILDHPNIVKVLDVFHNDFFVQLVMEKHGAGLDLFEFIDRRPKCDEKLKSYIFRQVVSAVNYLHSLGVLHRDIKDENIIINEKFEVKLIDFGAASFIPDDKSFSKFYGTLEYCSPEVLEGNSYRGPELEVWALGITLYILIFEENPFCDFQDIIKGEFSIPSPISEELNQLLHKMLDKNVKTRITVDKLIENSWINQPVCVENYKFEEVLCCNDHEAHPPKYDFDISPENFSEADFKAHEKESNESFLCRTASALNDSDVENQQSVENFI